MNEAWDVIIVGARCAGATLAALLARAGMRILVLEAAAKGSDMPMSTHFLQAPGMDVLDRIGVGQRVRAVTPPVRRLRVALDDAALVMQAPSGREGYCVRRKTLDPWLQQAAVEAGAELRDRHRVVALVEEAGRVQGVVARTPARTTTLRAKLVVGADGPTSTVAMLTGVEEYLVTRSERGGYWGYYPAPSSWDMSWDGSNEHLGIEQRFAFRTDGGQMMLAVVTTAEAARAWQGSPAEKLHAALRAGATTRTLVQEREPIGQVHGMFKAKYFYRRPVGPGFALVGDAGHVSNFATAQGMTEALMDAARLARTILDGREAAYELYWRERDVATLPLHFDAERQGQTGYNEPFMRWALARMSDDEEMLERLPLVHDRKLDPAALLPTHKLLWWMLGALLRGRFDVWRGFLRAGRALSRERRELAQRRLRHRRCVQALASQPIGQCDAAETLDGARAAIIPPASKSPFPNTRP